jgi:hypothetical protein
MRHGIRYVIPLVCVTLIALRSLAAQSVPIRVVPYLPTVSLTQCDGIGGIEILITEAADASPLGVFYLIHELTHVPQMRVAGGCAAATVRYLADADFRMRMELGAYCAEATAMHAAGVLLDHFIVTPSNGETMRFPFYLYLVYGRPRLTLPETEQIVRDECPILATSPEAP